MDEQKGNGILLGVGFVCPVAFLSVAVQFDELSPGRNDENKSGIVYMVSCSYCELSKRIFNSLDLNRSKRFAPDTAI